MRRTWTLLGFVAAVFVGGALLAPWIYRAMQSAAGHATWLKTLADEPFPRFVSRTLMLVALLGLWPLSRMLRMAAPELGCKPFDVRELTRGAVLGLVTLGLFIGFALLFEGRQIRAGIPFARLARGIATALVAAAAVGFLEELVFRGVVFGGLRPELGWRKALLVSSLLFSAVHFLQAPRWSGDVQWWSGFQLLSRMFSMGSQAENRLAQALNLAVCGAVLALAYQRTGRLWFSVGLHGGWVFWLKLANILTLPSGPATAAWWGTRKVIDGWCVLPLLLLSLIAAAKMTVRRAPTHVFTEPRNVAQVG